MDLMEITTNPKPKANVKVASGTALPVVAVGDLTLSDLSRFILASDGTRTPSTTDGTWHNMLIVDQATESKSEGLKTLKRSPLHIHTASCHAGTQQVQTSNVFIDGNKATPSIAQRLDLYWMHSRRHKNCSSYRKYSSKEQKD